MEDGKKVHELMHVESDLSYTLTTPGVVTEGRKKLISKSMDTFFTEVEAIDLSLKLVELLELIHKRNVVHTNLCPEEIFLKDKKLD